MFTKEKLYYNRRNCKKRVGTLLIIYLKDIFGEEREYEIIIILYNGYY